MTAADPVRLRNTVLLQGLRLVAVGVGAGLAAAYGLSGYLASMVFGIATRDPIVFVTVPVVLGTVAALGVWLPARSASRIDPMRVLRFD